MSCDETATQNPCGSAFRNVLEDNHVPARNRYKNAMVEDSANDKFYLYDACGAYVEIGAGGGGGGGDDDQTLAVLSLWRLQISGGNTVTLPYAIVGMVAADNAPAEVKARANYVCDGTDDQVQINAALAAFSDVVLSQGQFNISSPILVNTDNHLHGVGTGTLVRAINGFNNQNMIQPAAVSGPTYFVEIDHFRLDGNKDNQTGGFDLTLGHGIHGIRAHTWSVHNMHIKETYRAGVRWAGDSGDFGINNSVDHCRIEDTGWHSIFVHFFAPNNHIRNNILGDTDENYCIELANSETIVMGNHIHGAASHNILVTGLRNKIMNNILELGGNQLRGAPGDNPTADNVNITNTAEGTTVEGNTMFDAGNAGVTDNGTNSIINGNKFLNIRVGDYQDYGIALGADSDGAMVSGNNLVDPNAAMTAFLIDAGATNYRIGPNYPDDDDNIASSRESITIQVYPGATNNATGDGKAYLTIPAAWANRILSRVHARVVAAGTTGTEDIQIHNVTAAVDMLSTKLTIDTGETGSNTAATPAVINPSNDNVAAYDLLRIDIDAVHTTPATGLIVTLEFKLP